MNDFQYVHWSGLPHRATHVEIVDSKGRFFVWEREDGRLEIPGGHVDWLTTQDRPETYEEAARREVVEELQLPEMWGCTKKKAIQRVRGRLVRVGKFVNQIPGSHVNNNEWVEAYRLRWPANWRDPREFLRWLAKQNKDGTVEGKAESARWMSLGNLKKKALANPMGINAALRLFLRRRGTLAPIVLSVFVSKFDDYRKKVCPGLP